LLPETATNVAGNGNKCCRKRQQMLPETIGNGDFVARNSDFLSPFSATTLAGAAEYLAVS